MTPALSSSLTRQRNASVRATAWSFGVIDCIGHLCVASPNVARPRGRESALLLLVTREALAGGDTAFNEQSPVLEYGEAAQRLF